MGFRELFDAHEGHQGLIGVFVAMLEMIKQGYLAARQEGCFGPIVITFQGPADLTVEEILAPTAGEEGELSQPEVAVELQAGESGGGVSERNGDTDDRG